MDAVLKMISWSFNVLATGLYPAFKHDQTPFEDELRWAQRGMPIAEGWCGALCEMRADLLEFVSACGFKTWSNLENPCFCCTCKKESLFEFPANLASSTWQKRDAATYNDMVRQSIATTINTVDFLEKLIAELNFEDSFAKQLGKLPIKE